MKAMNWILGAVVAAAILAPLQGAKAWGGGPYGGGDAYERYPGPYRGGDYDGGDRGQYRGQYRGHYRGHRGYYGSSQNLPQIVR